MDKPTNVLNGERGKSNKREKKYERVYNCDICAKSFTIRNSFRRHLLLHINHQKYRCKICGKKFWRSFRLEMHMYVHSNEKNFFCTQCDRRFKTSESLKHHITQRHSGKDYYCKICNRQFSTSFIYKEHLALHLNKKDFICADCGKQYATKRSLRSHIMSIHIGSTYKCADCGKEFQLRNSYKSHRRHHMIKKHQCTRCNKRFIYKYLYDQHSCLSVRERQLFCIKCDEKFATKLLFSHHTITVHFDTPYNCINCGELFATKEELSKHSLIHSTDIYTCAHCNKTYRAKHSLKRHMTIHFDNKLVCKLCGKRFTRKYLIDEHMIYHENKVAFRCSICNKEFASKGNLKQHRWVHQEKQIPCPQCEKRFVKESQLIQHMHMHLTNYKCKQCGKQFRWEHKLKKHTVLNHSKYRCEYCDKEFESIGLNKLHLRMHDADKFTCDDCGRQYRDKQKLKTHILGHWKYPCTQCGVVFRLKKEYKKHVLTHEDLKCQHCGKQFQQKQQLLQHLESHTNMNGYLCEVCCMKFSSNVILNCHKIKYHGPMENFESLKIKKLKQEDSEGQEWQVNFVQNDIDHTNESQKRKNGHECEQCGKRFQYPSNLKQHIMIHDPLRISKSCYKKAKNNIGTEESTPNASKLKKYKCGECDQLFRFKHSLKQHAVIHDPTRKNTNRKKIKENQHFAKNEGRSFIKSKHECAYCGKKFNTNKNLKLHECARSDKRFFECDYCRKAYLSKVALKRHVIGIHCVMKRKHYCKKCGEEFSLQREFTKHLATHVQNSLQCNRCGQRFRRKGFFDRHVRLKCGSTSINRSQHNKTYKITTFTLTTVTENNDQNMLRSNVNGKRSVRRPKCFCCKGNEHGYSQAPVRESEVNVMSDNLSREQKNLHNFRKENQPNISPTDLEEKLLKKSTEVDSLNTENVLNALEIKVEPNVEIKEEEEENIEDADSENMSHISFPGIHIYYPLLALQEEIKDENKLSENEIKTQNITKTSESTSSNFEESNITVVNEIFFAKNEIKLENNTAESVIPDLKNNDDILNVIISDMQNVNSENIMSVYSKSSTTNIKESNYHFKHTFFCCTEYEETKKYDSVQSKYTTKK